MMVLTQSVFIIDCITTVVTISKLWLAQTVLKVSLAMVNETGNLVALCIC